MPSIMLAESGNKSRKQRIRKRWQYHLASRKYLLRSWSSPWRLIYLAEVRTAICSIHDRTKCHHKTSPEHLQKRKAWTGISICKICTYCTRRNKRGHVREKKKNSSQFAYCHNDKSHQSIKWAQQKIKVQGVFLKTSERHCMFSTARRDHSAITSRLSGFRKKFRSLNPGFYLFLKPPSISEKLQ